MQRRKAKTLPPLRDSPSYWEAIEEALRRAVWEEVFQPLFGAIDIEAPKKPPSGTGTEMQVENAKKPVQPYSDLSLALQKGKIQYSDGHFRGKFDHKTSRELKQMGARFDRRSGAWVLPQSKLTPEIKSAVSVSISRFRAMADRANETLNKISPDVIAGKIKLDSLFDSSIFKMDQAFKANVKRLGIQIELTEDMRAHIAKRYSENTKLDIKGWVEDEVDELRKKVQAHTLDSGLRRETLVADIKKRYGVSARKAKFLARQETSLLMSAFQEKRYTDAGLNRYEWKCVNNPPAPRNQKPRPHQVRPDHWDLNGEIFSWSNPPVVDKRTGRRANPKQDYNCRCMALPVIE